MKGGGNERYGEGANSTEPESIWAPEGGRVTGELDGGGHLGAEAKEGQGGRRPENAL